MHRAHQQHSIEQGGRTPTAEKELKVKHFYKTFCGWNVDQILFVHLKSCIMFNGRCLVYISWLVVFLACSCIWSPSTKCATHWRFEDGEVNAIYNEIDEIWEKDTLFNILATSTSNIENPSKDNENSSSDMLSLPTQIDVQDSNDQQDMDANSRYNPHFLI